MVTSRAFLVAMVKLVVSLVDFNLSVSIQTKPYIGMSTVTLQMQF